MAYELRALRVGMGLTQAQLADKLGVSNLTVSRWEQGKGMPAPKNIKKMSEIFGVPGKDIFFELINNQS